MALRSRPDRKYLLLKIRVSPGQMEQIVKAVARSNPSNPPGVSTWLRDIALKAATRINRAAQS